MISQWYCTFYKKIRNESEPTESCVSISMQSTYLQCFIEWGHQRDWLHERRGIWESIIQNHVEFNSSCPFGILNDFALPTAQLDTSATRQEDFVHGIQSLFYSGYLWRQGLTVQVVYLPVEIICSVFYKTLTEWHTCPKYYYLGDLLSGTFVVWLVPCLYCDGKFWVPETTLPWFVNPSLIYN